ncbi:hypothetical protein P3X46_003810 [Hevea brasiliensis]|uniref:DUF1442 family protein n=1 Tax=Hevea brasiliensis TaxID=3981 RepID=A0ABQ9NAN2_HEVBR|nr:uncharacterized protein LOC110662986 isoform X1 [Hevea brasiliensis]KAJ9188453.1 hypothetical protein P3X46_003810 [Hevea brasiliensis]
MACWSAENATKAYLRALKMGKRSKEPDMAEFISALAAGNNAQLMVVASARVAGSTTLPLVAAAQQTGGQVMCILSTESDFIASRNSLGPYADCVKFVIGDAKALLLSDYKRADFVLIDCNIDDCEGVFRAARECGRNGRRLIIGFNAFQGSWPNEFKTHFLPIGEGLLVTRIGGKVDDGSGQRKRSRWVIRVDECTGEEHVYRVTCPQQEIEA